MATRRLPPAGGAMAAVAPDPVIRSWGVSGWYALAYVGIFALITLPVLLAAILNLLGFQGANWYVLAVVTAAIDLPILFYPWPAIGLSIAEFIRRLREKSPEDTVTMPRVYRTIVISILATRLAIAVLAILPVARNGGPIAIFLGLIGMVWLGNLIYAKSTWFVERVWNFYVVLLVGAVGYWIMVSIWPELRHSAAKSAANDTEQAILDQNEAWLKKEQRRIEKLLLDMPPRLSPAERVQQLKSEDQATWAKIQASSFAGKTVDKAASAIPGLKKLGDAASAAASGAQSSATASTQTYSCQQPGRPASFQKELIYCPGLANGPQSFGKLDTPKRFKLVCEGTRQMRVYGGGGAKDWPVDCQGNGFNGAAGTTPAPDHWSFTLKGEAIGKVVAYADGVTQQQGSCFDAKDEIRVDANDGHYRQGGHGGLRVKLVEC